MKLKCPHCGFCENPMNAKFCGKCGGKIHKKQISMEKSKAILDIISSLRKEKSIFRDGLCPCGSGKKYRNCHGKHIR